MSATTSTATSLSQQRARRGTANKLQKQGSCSAPQEQQRQQQTDERIRRWREQPAIDAVRPLKVSGGTAHFFRVVSLSSSSSSRPPVARRNPPSSAMVEGVDGPPNTPSHRPRPSAHISWVLKDVAHAKEEVAFYERVREQILTAKSREAKRLARFLDVFFCVCPGVVQLPEETLEDACRATSSSGVHLVVGEGEREGGTSRKITAGGGGGGEDRAAAPTAGAALVCGNTGSTSSGIATASADNKFVTSSQATPPSSTENFVPSSCGGGGAGALDKPSDEENKNENDINDTNSGRLQGLLEPHHEHHVNYDFAALSGDVSGGGFSFSIETERIDEGGGGGTTPRGGGLRFPAGARTCISPSTFIRADHDSGADEGSTRARAAGVSKVVAFVETENAPAIIRSPTTASNITGSSSSSSFAPERNADQEDECIGEVVATKSVETSHPLLPEVLPISSQPHRTKTRPHRSFLILSDLLSTSTSLAPAPSTSSPCTSSSSSTVSSSTSSGSASSPAKSFRFADLKLGKQTAVAGWMGKSAFRAWKNHQIDRVTNSAAESFRVEGIDNPPGLLESCYFAVANSKTWSLLFSKVPSISISSGGNNASSSGADSASSSKKKIDRITLQRLNGVRFWRLMLDFSDAATASFQKRTTFTKRNELYARFLLLSVLVKLTKLVNGLCQIEWPQMWVGSSVGIGLDLANVVGGVGEVPGQGATDAGAAVRGAGEQQQRRADPVTVRLFDWGRSEFNTKQHHEGLSKSERELRILWREYLQAVVSLLYHSARTFLHRFTSPVWRSVVLVVQEFRSMHDPVAKAGAELPLFPAHVDVAAYYGLGEKNMESMKESCCTKEKGPEVVDETSETRSPSIESVGASCKSDQTSIRAEDEHAPEMEVTKTTSTSCAAGGRSRSSRGRGGPMFFAVGREYRVPLKTVPSVFIPCSTSSKAGEVEVDLDEDPLLAVDAAVLESSTSTSTSTSASCSASASTFGYMTVRFHVLTESRVSLELTDFYLNPHSPGAKQARNLNVCVLAFEDTRDGFVHLSEVLHSTVGAKGGSSSSPSAAGAGSSSSSEEVDDPEKKNGGADHDLPTSTTSTAAGRDRPIAVGGAFRGRVADHHTPLLVPLPDEPAAGDELVEGNDKDSKMKSGGGAAADGGEEDQREQMEASAKNENLKGEARTSGGVYNREGAVREGGFFSSAFLSGSVIGSPTGEGGSADEAEAGRSHAHAQHAALPDINHGTTTSRGDVGAAAVALMSEPAKEEKNSAKSWLLADPRSWFTSGYSEPEQPLSREDESSHFIGPEMLISGVDEDLSERPIVHPSTDQQPIPMSVTVGAGADKSVRSSSSRSRSNHAFVSSSYRPYVFQGGGVFYEFLTFKQEGERQLVTALNLPAEILQTRDRTTRTTPLVKVFPSPAVVKDGNSGLSWFGKQLASRWFHPDFLYDGAHVPEHWRVSGEAAGLVN